MKVTRREEDGDNFASSSVTFRIIVLLVGVFCGFVLSSHASSTGVQKLHSNVKKAYQAHNEAKKEYLKRYRESYLEAVLGRDAQKQEEERGEKGGNEAVAEVLATMTELAEDDIEKDNNRDDGVSSGVTPSSIIESPPPPSPLQPPAPSPSSSPEAAQHIRSNIHVYVFHHLSDFGLGHLMEEFADIYEICDMLGIGSVSIRECGTPHKPWHFGKKMKPCEDSFQHNKNVVKYGKRTSDIDVSLGPNEETEDMESFVHIDGQRENWIQALENMANPEIPTKVFVTMPHNKFITESKYNRVKVDNSCAVINKWFGDPSDFLLDELENHKKRQYIGKESKTHQNEIAFHFRLLDHEDLGIEVQPDLSIKRAHRGIQLGDQRLDSQNGYDRLAHLDLKRAVDDVIELAKKIFETSGLTTFVASDSPAIQAYLKNNPVISMIEHGEGMSDTQGEVEISDLRDINESHYSLTSALELYELGTAKKIVSFPFSSGFSRAASCLIKDGKYFNSVKTVDDLEGFIREHMKEFIVRSGDDGFPVIKEEVAVIMDSDARAPTPSDLPPFNYESECKLAESYGNRFLSYDFREYLPSEDQGYPQMAATGWEPYRWRDDETYISTWTSLNAQGSVNKALSNLTLSDDKKMCVRGKPERLASDVAIVHFRCADVPFSDELSYPLAPPEYSVFVGKKLKELEVKRIMPVMCSIHKVDESIAEERKRLCTELFNAQLDIIKRELTNEISMDAISCLSDIETLFLARGAAAVVQLIPSSFTFIAGIARTESKSFITPHYGLTGAKAISVLQPLGKEEKLRLRLKNMADKLPWTMFCPGCGGEEQDVFYPDSGFIGWNYSFARDRLMQFHKEMTTKNNNNR